MATKKKYWSGDVIKKSNALDLEPGAFTWKKREKCALFETVGRE